MVCYKGGALSYTIAKQLVKVKYISLVNLVMDREVVKELIQADFSAKNVATELNKLMQPDYRSRVEADYSTLKENLGGIGASANAAIIVLETAQ